MTVWQIIATAFIVLIVYFTISSRRETERLERIRTQAVPHGRDAVKIRADMRYQVRMSDGRRFDDVEILGQISGGDNPFGGWDGLFVLRFTDGRRAFIRQGCVRCIVEMQAV